MTTIAAGRLTQFRFFNQIQKVLDKHTDLISSTGILGITTCLLAAKVFDNTPKFLPKTANIIFSYGGVIWLNVQVKDFLKSTRDLSYAFKEKDYIGLIETSAKVFVKGINILLTVTFFTASLVTAVGHPEISLAIFLLLRPISLVSLGINIGSDVRDYVENEKLLINLTSLEEKNGLKETAEKVTECFRQIVTNKGNASLQKGNTRRLSFKLVRQLNNYTLETYKDGLVNPKKDTQELYQSMKESLQATQKFTKANLGLTALGYASMGVCKAFPETVTEKATRFGISLLYTGKLLLEKISDRNLARNLKNIRSNSGAKPLMNQLD